ncbi:hypothetical protein N474_08660 [Pseudoalteromonas luteoviolacea CPMOR-2]|uniref:sulfite exporter TauE/SafE family protein n=1 Tax=Pseudoalteromonas luteoviolacea TaxID=43657 RepID=UPI0007B03E24|nr:sulfite exporter TauE/SafE family protein [Pseudoalteromonas luteoviolacea]KZN57261.1 hypothetical protein N474_08660 [Pseudoalteromonas luteoviolacea CPMOR-2]
MEYTNVTTAIILGVFGFAGLIKGVVGLGLPPIVLGLLTAIIGIHPAMALVALPAFITNIVQAISGQYWHTLWLTQRLFFFFATISVALGCLLTQFVDQTHMSLLLGVLLVCYGSLGIMQFKPRISAPWQPRAGVLLGVCNGVFTGLTGSSAVPGVFYLQAIGLPKEKLIQAMGILFTCSSLGLSIGLIWQGILTPSTSALSVAALLPATLCMFVGAKLRKRISVAVFQRIFYSALTLLGAYVIVKNSALIV